MNALGWNTLLFGLKWVFIGLVYFVLIFVVLAVRREMAVRARATPEETSFSPGRLKVVTIGSDPHLRPGLLLDLKPVTALGAQSDNDLILRDRFVSRSHARLRWDGVGWWIEDLGSRNGTYVNNIAIAPNVPTKLENGSMIGVGGVAFQLIE